MNSNYEWQKHQANERVQKYQQEAAAHRLAANGNGRSSGKVLLKLATLAGIFFMLWLTVGCTTEVPTAEAASQPSSWALANRIEFQDKREAYLDWHSGTAHVTKMTMAERIVFQDRVLGNSR